MSHTAPREATASPESELLRHEVDSLLRELSAYQMRIDKDPITPANLVGLINRAVGKRLPDPAPDLLEDVQRNLEDASFADLADREVIRGLALLTYYSLQVQTESLRQPISEGFHRLPGYSMINELRNSLKGKSLADLSGPDVWAGMWRQASYSALQKLDELLKEYEETN